jgi:predicted amidohydrolase YtcJ
MPSPDVRRDEIRSLTNVSAAPRELCGRPLMVDRGGRLALGEPCAVEIRDGRIARCRAVAEAGEATLGAPDAVLAPGWIDSHIHLLACAADRAGVDLSGSRPRHLAELLDRIAVASRDLPTHAWVRISGHDESWLAERRHPTRVELDSAGGGRPVRLRHATRHASILSSSAWRALAESSPDLPGERAPRDATGEPLGVAFGLEREITAAAGPIAPQALAEGLAAASDDLLACGVVALDEMSAANDAARVAVLAEAVASGRLRQDVRVFLGDADELDAARAASAGRVVIAGVKLLPRDAAEIATGGFARALERARMRGLPVAVHAVEADAVDAAIDALAAAPPRAGGEGGPDRIEHASLCPPELARRLAAARIAVVTQPAFLFARGDKYREEVEAVLWPWLYPLATLRAAGVLLVGSSDAPVATADPRVAMAAATARTSASGTVLGEAERIDEAAAFALYTSAPRALRGESPGGSWLDVGRRADLLVLDGDPRGGRWRDVAVRFAVVAGQSDRACGWTSP